MEYIENEYVYRHIRKKHKDWSPEKVKQEAERMWKKYLEDNKERIEKERLENEKRFNESIELEFRSLWLDSLD
jgi:transposase